MTQFRLSAFSPPLLLRGGHVQSLAGRVGPRNHRAHARAADLIAASEKLIADCGDGVRLLLHHTPPKAAGNGQLAVLIHGWEGSSDSPYMLTNAVSLWEAGYRVIRLNLRDHGESHHLNKELFHSCRLDEVVGAVRWLNERYPDEPLALGGFSLGGNFALRVGAVASESGLRLRAIVAVCPVLDPEETMQALDGGFVVYQQYFLRKWRRSLEKKRSLFPAHYTFGDMGRFRSLESVTRFFIEEYTDYPDMQTYLRGYAITGERLATIRVPSRILLADDDPVIPVGSVSKLARPETMVIERAAFGGHCGFVKDYALRSWLDDYMVTVLSEDALLS